MILDKFEKITFLHTGIDFIINYIIVFWKHILELKSVTCVSVQNLRIEKSNSPDPSNFEPLCERGNVLANFSNV